MGNVTKLEDKRSEMDEGLEGFEQKTITVRGKEYTFRELSSTEYDDCVRGSTDVKTGDIDTVQLLRRMIIKGSVEPKLDASALGKLPFGVVGKISGAVNDLHFMPEDLTPLGDRLRDAGWTVEKPEDGDAPKGS